LLGQIPLSLTSKNSCSRNTAAEQDTANVLASVTCKPDGAEANTVTFTQFASDQALGSHYQPVVATAGVAPSFGDCLNAERAENTYSSVSNQTNGRVVCYEERGSSFVTWTDQRVRTLAQATRFDPDYMKLRDWWAGVVGLPTSGETAAQAQARKQVEDAQKQADETKKEAEAAQKQQAEEAQKQAAAAQQQIQDAQKQAQAAQQQQALQAQQQQAEEAQQQAQQNQNEGNQDQNGGSQDSSGRGGRDPRGHNRGHGRGNDDQGNGSGNGDQGNGSGNGGQGNGSTNISSQDIQKIVDDAVRQALQQLGNTGGGQELRRQQLEDSVRKSIQQKGGAGGQDLQQLINNAINQAMQQRTQSGR
jgi:flagellar biosynthesis GTPase FlhF